MDVFNFPDSNIIQWVFNASGSVNSWQIWQKPRNCKFISILAIGGGGGGGGGTAGAANTNRAGGGGGGGAAVCRTFYNANVLPDTLYVLVGAGGPGGASGGNGTAGGLSYVSVEANITTPVNIVIRSGAAGAGAGLAAGGAGAAGTIVNQNTIFHSYLGYFQATAGTIGAAGVSANNGNSITVSFITTGGAAGGGASGAASFAGGNITGLGSIPTINGGAAGATNPGSSGLQSIRPSSNLHLNQPIFFTGGAGGGGFRTATGGAGGNGAIGCGGGGGGAGLTGAAGAGGRGGDGIVIITTW